MAWANKTKISQEVEQKILTPDGEDILVGVDEDEILTYAEAISNWGLQNKNEEGDWELKAKIEE